MSKRASAVAPRRRTWVRRWVGVAGILALVVVMWLGSHLLPRHAHFVERRGTLVEATVTVDSPREPALANELVHVRAETGLAVAFRVLRPAAGDAPRPLFVLLAGHRTGRNAVDVVGPQHDIAIAALDYPYEGPEKIRSLRQAIVELPGIQRALLDTPPAASLALDWLITQSWVDPDRVELVGVSLGTPFAAVAGALDPRFRRVWLVHGGADHREWLDGALRDKNSSPALRSAAASLGYLLAHGASFDTDYWVPRIAPRPVVVIGARNDETLTSANIEDLFNAAGEPRQLYWTEGGHITTRRPEVVREVLAIAITEP